MFLTKVRLWCVFTTLLEPTLSKIREDVRSACVVKRNLIVRSDDTPPPASRTRRQHFGKIFLCYSDLRATDFSFKKGKEILASVFRPQRFGRARLHERLAVKNFLPLAPSIFDRELQEKFLERRVCFVVKTIKICNNEFVKANFLWNTKLVTRH